MYVNGIVYKQISALVYMKLLLLKTELSVCIHNETQNFKSGFHRTNNHGNIV